MDCQDWSRMIINKKYEVKNTNEMSRLGKTTTVKKTTNGGAGLKSLDDDATESKIFKKYVAPESIRELISKRIEMKLTQDKADALCSFPKHTFRDLESNKLVPSEKQKQSISRNFSINLKIISS